MIVCLSPLTDASFPNTPCGALRRRFFAGRRGGVNSALSASHTRVLSLPLAREKEKR
jgi:hypothetical protein